MCIPLTLDLQPDVHLSFRVVNSITSSLDFSLIIYSLSWIHQAVTLSDEEVKRDLIIVQAVA